MTSNLNYHVDIRYVMPREIFADPGRAAALAQAGIEAESIGNTRALFRDPATVEALLRAPQWLQDAMVDAGFGLTPSGETGPVSQFDELEDRHRMKKFSKLLPVLKEHPDGWNLFTGGFDTRLLWAHESRMQALAGMKQDKPGDAETVRVCLIYAKDLERQANVPSPDWPTAADADAGREADRRRAQPTAQTVGGGGAGRSRKAAMRGPVKLALAVLILGLPFYGPFLTEPALIIGLLDGAMISSTR